MRLSAPWELQGPEFAALDGASSPRWPGRKREPERDFVEVPISRSASVLPGRYKNNSHLVPLDFQEDLVNERDGGEKHRAGALSMEGIEEQARTVQMQRAKLVALPFLLGHQEV